ncbi:zinc finger protein 11-like [Cydia strobilella]|uniref:zinc finger protein 11-like n=1 Tax=Cydia strobilella TaxID=1100964 RepID=UPI00300694D6
MDTSRLCRSCMKEVASWELENYDQRAVYMFTLCTNIQIPENDMLPKQFCYDCTIKIESSYTFIKEAQHVNDTLTNLLTQRTVIVEPIKRSEQNDEPDVEVSTFEPEDTIDEPTSNTTDNIVKTKVKKVSHQKHVCTVCKKMFLSKVWFEKHMRNQHNGKVYSCAQCPKTFQRPSQLSVHAVTHSSERRYACSCGKRYKRRKELAQHARTHAAARPYQCDHCNMSFKLKSVLKSHLVVHKPDKPHLCYICGWSFKQAGNLAVHMRTHTGAKPHACACGFRAASASGLRRHEARHRARALCCRKCDKRFYDNTALVQLTLAARRARPACAATRRATAHAHCAAAINASRTASASGLRRHEARHRARALCCRKCDKRFYDNTALVQLTLAARRARPACAATRRATAHAHCAAAINASRTASASGLRRHEARHRARALCCRKCDKRFYDNTALVQLTLAARRARPACAATRRATAHAHCAAAINASRTASASGLRRHEARHRARALCCRKCDKRFYDNTALVQLTLAARRARPACAATRRATAHAHCAAAINASRTASASGLRRHEARHRARALCCRKCDKRFYDNTALVQLTLAARRARPACAATRRATAHAHCAAAINASRTASASGLRRHEARHRARALCCRKCDKRFYDNTALVQLTLAARRARPACAATRRATAHAHCAAAINASRTASASGLRRHEARHRARALCCRKCDKRFYDNTALVQLTLAARRARPACAATRRATAHAHCAAAINASRTASASGLRRHEARHRARALCCRKCDKRFYDNTALVQLTLAARRARPACAATRRATAHAHCAAAINASRTASASGLRRHEARHRARALCCRKCDKRFYDNTALVQLTLAARRARPACAATRRATAHAHCAAAINASRTASASGLRRHEARHRARALCCRKCDKRFYDNTALVQLTLAARRARPACAATRRATAHAHCAAAINASRTASASGLRRHEARHRARALCCRKCDKRFYDNTALVQLTLAARRARPACAATRRATAHAHCAAAINASRTASASGLRRHEARHRARALCCRKCDKRFYDNTALTRHLRSHTGARPYRCPACARTFADSWKRKLHLMRAHRVPLARIPRMRADPSVRVCP